MLQRHPPLEVAARGAYRFAHLGITKPRGGVFALPVAGGNQLAPEGIAWDTAPACLWGADTRGVNGARLQYLHDGPAS